jgi:hypothetical protein
MSRLGGPRPAAEDKNSAKSKSARKDDDDDDAGGAKQPGKGLGTRGSTGNLLPPPESFRPNEVLAYNLPKADLLRIEKLKYKVLSTYELRSLNLTVTRLEVPTVQNAFIGRGVLQEELPTSGFGLNHIYRTDRPTPANAPPGGATDGGTAPVKSAAAPAIAAPGTNVHRPGLGCAPDRCFGVSAINWQPKLAACARGVRIGVIDTGVDKNHPAFADVLAGKRLRHKDFTPPNSKKPSSQHGTGVLSLLAGNAHSSTPGLVTDATFLVGDAFFTDRNGNAISDTVTMLKAIDWLIEQGVDVANLSFAGPPDEFVHDSIRKLARKGTVILAAAGNEGRDAPPSYPAAYPEVIAVTAVDRNLAAYAYAGRGDHIDVAAPGVEVWTALPNRREGPQTGTSFAVPFVTSVIAVNHPPAEMRADGNPLAPKRRALALLQKDIKAIGDRGGRNPVFGVGLVQAPSHCDPRMPDALISSGPKMQPAPFVPAGSWESTVHPVANRK